MTSHSDHTDGHDRDQLLTLAEAAEFLRTPAATLRYWRNQHTGPNSFKIGRRVFYWLSELMAWLDRQAGEASIVR